MINLNKNSVNIFLYHGVTDSASYGVENFLNKHINYKIFKKQIKYIKDNSYVISMNDIVTLKKNKINETYSVITFDDGFENNYTVAAPILVDCKVSATFYITSGIVNTDIMFWVDKIEDCVNNSYKKNINMDLEKKHRFNISSISDKISTIMTIKNYCKKVDSLKKDNVVKQLEYETGVLPSILHAVNYRKITWPQILEMHKSGFLIGGHGLYHNILSKLSKKDMYMEISASISLLKYNLRSNINHYSYPEGLPDHFDSDVIECLKENGIVCCPTAINGGNNEIVDLFDLKRITL